MSMMVRSALDLLGGVRQLLQQSISRLAGVGKFYLRNGR